VKVVSMVSSTKEEILRLPIVLSGSKWASAITEFFERVKEELGDDLLEVVAAPDEEAMVYDSNVLVIVRRNSAEVRHTVVRAETEVERIYGVSISPLIVSKKDVGFINSFIRSQMAADVKIGDWISAVKEFYNKIRKSLGDEVLEVVVAPDEDAMIYESNVLVVIRGNFVRAMRAIAEMEAEVERIYGVSISPLIVSDRKLADNFVIAGWRKLED